MNVAHLACIAPPQIGGIGQAAYDEVMGLRERGVEAQLVSSRYATVNTFVSPMSGEVGSGVVRLPAYFQSGNAAIVRGLNRIITNTDILHLHYPWYGVAERLLWSRPQKPVILTFHMDAQADDWRGVIFSAHRRLVQPRLLRHATRILVSSRDYAEHSSLAPCLSEIEDKLVELPFALDTEFFSPKKEKSQSVKNVARLLFVGGLDKAHHFKGLPLLLQAMTKLPPSVHLTIVGDGEERARFEKSVEELGLASRVQFLGRLSRESLRNTYREADILTFPSTSAAEAFGLVALEAHACGVPVVASRLPGVRTVVRDGETGILVTPGCVSGLVEGVATLLSDPEKRQIYAKNARKQAVGSYAREHHLDRLLELYQGICL